MCSPPYCYTVCTYILSVAGIPVVQVRTVTNLGIETNMQSGFETSVFFPTSPKILETNGRYINTTPSLTNSATK